MKLLLLLNFFLFSVSLVGCTFLKGAGGEEEDFEESIYEEEDSGEYSMDEEGEDEEDEISEDPEEEISEDYGEEEGEEEEEEDEMEDSSEEPEKKGFFSKLFGFFTGDSEDEEEKDYGEDEGDYDEEEDDYGEGEEDYDEEGDSIDGFLEEEDEESEAERESPVQETGEASVSPPSEEPAVATPPVSPPAVSSPDTEVSADPPKKIIPLKKIRTQTYRKGAYLVNGVYIARSGDTMETVSQKIYNGDNVEALYTVNPHLRSRAIKVGDKVYYNSPRRSQDASRILFYYEDFGIPSKAHIIEPGQNIRTVASALLGHKNSWKEIWATNPGLVSKGVVSQMVELKYWPPGESAPLPPPERTPEETVSPEGDPLSGEDLKMGENLEGFPEEGKEEPEDSSKKASEDISENKEGFNIGQILILIGGLVLILLSFMMVIKKRRQRQEFDYTATNIKPP